jgi:hypothetical protein
MVLLRILRRLLLPCTRSSPLDSAPEQHRDSRPIAGTPTNSHSPSRHTTDDQLLSPIEVLQEAQRNVDNTRKFNCTMPKRKAQPGSEDVVETPVKKTKSVPRKKGKAADENGESSTSLASAIQPATSRETSMVVRWWKQISATPTSARIAASRDHASLSNIVA